MTDFKRIAQELREAGPSGWSKDDCYEIAAALEEVAELTSQRDDALERVKVLEHALRPFAELSGKYMASYRAEKLGQSDAPSASYADECAYEAGMQTVIDNIEVEMLTYAYAALQENKQ